MGISAVPKSQVQTLDDTEQAAKGRTYRKLTQQGGMELNMINDSDCGDPVQRAS